MTRRLLLTAIIWLMLPIPVHAETPSGLFTVVQVYDGDTIRVMGQGEEIKVRLVGIDSPETYKGESKPGQPFSRKSKDYLKDLVINKTVEIMSYGMDDYSRILGVVYLDGISINFEMVRAGLAEVYRARPPLGFNITAYKEAEAEAKRAKRGMWILADNYISPWMWRRQHRP